MSDGSRSASRVHEAIRGGVDAETRAEVDRRREPRAPERGVDVLLAARDHAQRDLRRLAVERAPEKALARTEDVDDIAWLRRNIGHVGAIDPRVAATETLFTAGRDDGCWNHEGSRLRRLYVSAASQPAGTAPPALVVRGRAAALEGCAGARRRPTRAKPIAGASDSTSRRRRRASVQSAAMHVALGADHAGFELKNALKRVLDELGVAYDDFGTGSAESVDYPDYAKAVGESVVEGRLDRGILVCGSGIGMSIAANKVHGIRAAVVTEVESARLSRAHNDANVIALGARLTSEADAAAIVRTFLDTEFQGGRHAERIEKIRGLERG